MFISEMKTGALCNITTIFRVEIPSLFKNWNYYTSKTVFADARSDS